ncbi:MAG: DUF3791 domain-containing protein [Eubacterium sp.]|nr:DUF3791 domain-containing protein [Eubacterium sp.]
MAENNSIKNSEELEFAVFCIENTAIKLGVSADRVYKALTEKSSLLNEYIIPCYEPLHSQGKDYIVDDIISALEEKGITV